MKAGEAAAEDEGVEEATGGKLLVKRAAGELIPVKSVVFSLITRPLCADMMTDDGERNFKKNKTF